VIGSVFLWIGAIAGGLVLVVLITPLRIRINGRIDDRQGVGYDLDVDWAVGVLSIDKRFGNPWQLYVLGRRAMRFSGTGKRGGKKEKKRKKKRISPRSFAGPVKNHFQAFIRILEELARAAFLRGGLRGRIGLADPADTAKIGLIGHLANLRFRRFILLLACDYEEEVIEIEAAAQATLILGYLGLVAGRLMLQRQTRMALRSLRHA
jgi:hypothetical protein